MLSYERHGDGPAVVLAHGITENRHSFDPLIGPLAACYDVVAVDLRGFGQSTREPPFDPFTMASDLGGLVADLGLERPLVIGHSLGGTVVSAYAMNQTCRGVVNIDQPLRLGEFQQQLKAMESALKGSRAEFVATMTALFESMRGRLDDDEWTRLSALRTYDQEVVLEIWSLVFETPAEILDGLVESVAGAVTVPYLAIHGTDPGAGYEEWLTTHLRTATIEQWEGDGHYPHLVEPTRFLDRVRAFDSTTG